MKLDIPFVRKQFPAFQDPQANEWIFFENAASSYLAQQVIDRLNCYMVSTRVQPYSRHFPSESAGKQVDETFRLFAEAIHSEPEEVVFNASTSINFYILANALRSECKLGDEIIVTNQDHESNIGFWRRLSESGASIKEWRVDPKSGLLKIEALKELLTKNTKLVCVTHCSNVVAEIHDIRLIGDLVHNVGGMLVVDGVSYAPHGALDMKELDIDFYSYSLYKTYGPHLGLLYGKKHHLERLENQGHFFNASIPRKKWSPGGPQYAEIAAAAGVIEYYLDVFNHHFGASTESLNRKIKKVHELFHEQEVDVCKPILEFLKSHPQVRVLGGTEMIPHKRGPNLSFVHKTKSSKSIVEALTAKKIAATNYHFYAKRLFEALGIEDPEDGACRFSIVHYNTLEEAHKTVEILKRIL